MKKIIDLVRPRPEKVDGEIGIEIEVEGKRLPQNDIKYWKAVEDGSLRGESKEYVIKRPIKREEVDDALKNLSDAYKRNESVILESDRAGVHIHINVQDMSFNQLITFISLYLILEDPLTRFCGNKRIGNLFCLRLKDAEALLDTIEYASKYKDLACFEGDRIRYAAINLSSIKKYGSVEFRAMRSTKNFEEISKWVSILLKIKDRSMGYENPQRVVETLSASGGEQFFRDNLDGFEDLIYDTLDHDVMDSVRLVQGIAYSSDWKEGLEDFKENGNKIAIPKRNKVELPHLGGFNAILDAVGNENNDEGEITPLMIRRQYLFDRHTEEGKDKAKHLSKRFRKACEIYMNENNYISVKYGEGNDTFVVMTQNDVEVFTGAIAGRTVNKFSIEVKERNNG